MGGQTSRTRVYRMTRSRFTKFGDVTILLVLAFWLLSGCQKPQTEPISSGHLSRAISNDLQLSQVTLKPGQQNQDESPKANQVDTYALVGINEEWRRALPVRLNENTSFTIDVDAPGIIRLWLGTDPGNTPLSSSVPFLFQLNDGNKTSEKKIVKSCKTLSMDWQCVNIPVDLNGIVTVECAIDSTSAPEIDLGSCFYMGSPVFIPSKQITPKPDVYLIVLDSLRDRDTGMYGNSHVHTPTLDHLTRHAIQYVNAITSSSWTMPAVKNFMSGQYSNRFTSEGENLYRIRAPFPLIQGVLAESGWFTSAISANHLITVDKGYDRGFDVFDALPSEKWKHGSSELFLKRALKSLDETPDVPTFHYWHIMDPHDPYTPLEPFARECDPPGDSLVRASLHARESGHLNYESADGDGRLTDVEKEYLHDYYTGEIRQVDTLLTILFRRLKEINRYDSSLIIVTSDHGEEFGEHGYYQHGKTLFEEAVRIPLLMKLPYAKSVESVNLQVPWVSSVDLPQTICHILGETFPACAEGNILFPTPTEERTVYSMLHRRVKNRQGRVVWRAAFRDTRKLIWTNRHGWTGYNLERFPDEMHQVNVTDYSETQTSPLFESWKLLATDLQGFMNSEEIDSQDSSQNDKKLTQKLRQLGYIR